MKLLSHLFSLARLHSNYANAREKRNELILNLNIECTPRIPEFLINFVLFMSRHTIKQIIFILKVFKYTFDWKKPKSSSKSIIILKSKLFEYQILNKRIKRVWKAYGCFFSCCKINFTAFSVKLILNKLKIDYIYEAFNEDKIF